MEKQRETGLEKMLDSQDYGIIGNSPGIIKLKQDIRMLASKRVWVYIQGESGTGKRLVAEALHYNNQDTEHNEFVHINASAIPAELFESELFGHKKGAFTNAVDNKVGMLEKAAMGTFFIDEISKLRYDLQEKLLLALENRDGFFYRVGDTKQIPLNIGRVVSASSNDLMEQVNDKKFSEALFYRLCVATIKLPPLRQRGDDIIKIAKYHLNKYCRMYKTNNTPKFEDSAARALKDYRWKGNVRELMNLMEHLAVRHGNNKIITAEDIAGMVNEQKPIEVYPDTDKKGTFSETYTRESILAEGIRKAKELGLIEQLYPEDLIVQSQLKNQDLGQALQNITSAKNTLLHAGNELTGLAARLDLPEEIIFDYLKKGITEKAKIEPASTKAEEEQDIFYSDEVLPFLYDPKQGLYPAFASQFAKIPGLLSYALLLKKSMNSDKIYHERLGQKSLRNVMVFSPENIETLFPGNLNITELDEWPEQQREAGRYLLDKIQNGDEHQKFNEIAKNPLMFSTPTTILKKPYAVSSYQALNKAVQDTGAYVVARNSRLYCFVITPDITHQFISHSIDSDQAEELLLEDIFVSYAEGLGSWLLPNINPSKGLWIDKDKLSQIFGYENASDLDDVLMKNGITPKKDRQSNEYLLTYENSHHIDKRPDILSGEKAGFAKLRAAAIKEFGNEADQVLGRIFVNHYNKLRLDEHVYDAEYFSHLISYERVLSQAMKKI